MNKIICDGCGKEKELRAEGWTTMHYTSARGIFYRDYCPQCKEKIEYLLKIKEN